jgi:hypothetical protein
MPGSQWAMGQILGAATDEGHATQNHMQNHTWEIMGM